MGTRHLYLVRHAQRAPEAPGDGPLESGITPAGVEQARLVADRLAGLPITTIYCSPLRRAAETADLIALRHRAAQRVVLPMLAECSPVIPRGFESAFASVTPAEFSKMKRRADAAYARLFKAVRGEDTHELVISHGNLLRYLLLRALDVNTAVWGGLDLLNCSVSVVVCEPRRTWVAAIGDAGHLPPRLQTYVRDRIAHAF